MQFSPILADLRSATRPARSLFRVRERVFRQKVRNLTKIERKTVPTLDCLSLQFMVTDRVRALLFN